MRTRVPVSIYTATKYLNQIPPPPKQLKPVQFGLAPNITVETNSATKQVTEITVLVITLLENISIQLSLPQFYQQTHLPLLCRKAFSCCQHLILFQKSNSQRFSIVKQNVHTYKLTLTVLMTEWEVITERFP